LDALVQRLESVAKLLSGTKFGFERHDHSADGWQAVSVVGPWGNQFLVHSAEQPPALAALQPLADGATKMERTHHKYRATFGVRGGAGIRYIELFVDPGKAKRAAAFYRSRFG
jgi:hypothetical protein